jgi:hypothetical protein
VGDGPSNQLHDKDGKPLHISQGLTDEQVLNSPDMKAIRLGMLQGSWPAACERCRRTEEAGAVSVRNCYNGLFKHRWSEVIPQTGEDGSLSNPRVRYADIRLGNVCNLICSMCGPHSSRLWVDHFNSVQPPGYRVPPSLLTEVRANNWVKQYSVKWLIEQSLSSIESLRFAGGEPLIIPEMIEALEACIHSGRASEIDLAYNTNITVLPERVTRLWPRFRSVDIMCSVDAVGALNSYIRRPSKWSDIDRNLHELDDHFKEWKLRHVQFNTTVQIYNILNLSEIFDYLRTGFTHLDGVPKLLPLYYPNYLSIENLPPHIKEISKQRLLSARADAESRLGPKAKASSVDSIIAHLERAAKPRSLKDFFIFSENADREFKDSWREVCPELARLLSQQELDF